MCNFPWMDEDSSEICSLHNEPASFGDLHGLTLFCAGNQGSPAEPIAASFLPTRRGWVQPSSKPAVGVSFEHFDFEPSPAPAKFEARHFQWIGTVFKGFEGFPRKSLLVAR